MMKGDALHLGFPFMGHTGSLLEATSFEKACDAAPDLNMPDCVAGAQCTLGSLFSPFFGDLRKPSSNIAATNYCHQKPTALGKYCSGGVLSQQQRDRGSLY